MPEPSPRKPRLPSKPIMLTDVVVRQAKPRDDRYEIRDPSRPGFRLAVFPSGVRSFIFRYTFGGEYKRVTLGPPYPLTTLAKAIELHRTAADLLASGKDPGEGVKARRQGEVAANDTVTAHIKLYEDQHVATLADGTQGYVKAELKRLGHRVGSKDIRKVTPADVQGLIDAAMARGEAARNTMYKVAKAFFAWACAPGRANVESPAASIKRPSEDRRRDRVLDDDEIKVVWKAADDASGPAGAAVKLLLLTGCRRDEILYLRRSEVRASSIELPGSRTKNGVAHSVPLTWLMRRVIAERPKEGKFVLTGSDAGLGGHSKARNKIKTPDLEHWTFHDLRRSFSTGLARLKVPLEVAEKCLNHISGVSRDPLVLTYNKYQHKDEIVEAFNRWTDHVAELVGEKPVKEIAAA